MIVWRRGIAAAAAASWLAVAAGCALTQGPESVGRHVDDASITTTVKARLVENGTVDAKAIRVETSNGNVVLAGMARTPLEKDTAESVAMKVAGVKTVRNDLSLRH